ncbi:MAG: hypothetical protein AB7Q27_11050 [Acidimicrobiia bacterium]
MSVEEMARTASIALYAATEPVRPIDFTARRRGSRQPQLRLAVGLGVVVVVIVGVVVVMANRDDGTRVATTPKEVPRLVLGTVPEGLSPTGAADLPLASSGGIAFDTTLYGDAQTEAWLASDSAAGAGKRLLVLEVSVSGSESITPAEGDTVIVNGQEWVLSSFTDQLSLGAVIDGKNVALTSPGLDRDALVAMAQSVRVVDGAVRVEPSSGLKALARSAMPPSYILTAGRASGTTVGHIAGYQDSGDGNDVVMVSTTVASADDLAVLRADVVAAEPMIVRGHRGWGITQRFDDNAAFNTLVWFESDGVLATVSGTRPITELLSMAESLVVADDATWAELSQPLGVVADGTTVIGSGDLDGNAWRVTYSTSDGLCLEVQEDAQGSSSSCGDASIGTASSTPIGDGTITYRVVPASVGESTTTDCNGDTISAAVTNGDVVPGALVEVYLLNDCREGVDGVPVQATVPLDSGGSQVVTASGSSSGPATTRP